MLSQVLLSVLQGSAGTALALNNDHIFTTTAERDAYFVSNPLELKEDLSINTAGILQKRKGSQWVDHSQVVQGKAAPQTKINYSVDGLSNWSDILDTNTHKYWRWSTDGGVTWAPTPPELARFNAGNSSGGVPDPFEFRVGPEGTLQLLKNNKIIQESDEYGSWIINSVSTGTGSLHIGDLHSAGSANENMVFLNNDSRLAWHPCWGAISADGTQVIEQSARVHSSTISVAYPGGTVGTGTRDYNSMFTAANDAVFLYLDIIPRETYSGKLVLTVTKSSNGKEVSHFEYDANYATGVKAKVPFKYPLWMYTGQQFNTSITKPDGSFLKVTSNQANTEPYREASYRTFVDHIVFHAGNAALQASKLNLLTGNDRISASAIRDLPVMSASVLGMAKLGATMSINGNGELNTSVSPTSIKIRADQAARLSIPQSGGAVLAIQQDNGLTYGIEANTDPSVNANWKQIGSVATSVVSFNGRIGGVVPAKGDYNQKQIKTIHDTTLVEGWFGIDNTGIYWDDGV